MFSTLKFWLYVGGFALIVALIGGIYYAGHKAGSEAVKAEWLAANSKAEEDERLARLAREADVRKAEAALLAAGRRADDSDVRWRKARAAAGAIAIAGCPARDRPVALEQATAPAAPDDPAARFTPAGLGLWDSAWTGRQGEPVFGDPGDIAAGADRTASPLPTLEQGLDNHKENASRCSEDRRQLRELTGVIRRLQGRP